MCPLDVWYLGNDEFDGSVVVWGLDWGSCSVFDARALQPMSFHARWPGVNLHSEYVAGGTSGGITTKGDFAWMMSPETRVLCPRKL